MFCEYSNLFGDVGKGVHSYRIANIAIIDVLLTIIVSYIIYLVVPQYNFWIILIILFLIGIYAHHLFCVNTTIDKLLFV
jgi:hypothetical protein